MYFLTFTPLITVLESEQGSWETTLLSYECRTFLFKALHNVIERFVNASLPFLYLTGTLDMT